MFGFFGGNLSVGERVGKHIRQAAAARLKAPERVQQTARLGGVDPAVRKHLVAHARDLDLAEELAEPVGLRRAEDLGRRALLGDLAAGEEEDAARDIARKAHFVRHDDHRHALLREVLHHVEHLADHLRVERARGLVEEHHLRLHRQRPHDRHALLIQQPAAEFLARHAEARDVREDVERAFGVEAVDAEPAQTADDVAPPTVVFVVHHRDVVVTGAERCESEEISIGGSDNVDASAFEDFDYVALGHIHSPQNIGSPRIRYCGTPLKYSFSELSHSKSVTVAELGEKGELAVRTVPLKPLHELREIRGRYDELTLRSFYTDTDLPESYLRVILTDENDVPEAVGKLRTVYPYLMKLEYDNARPRHTADFSEAADVSSKSPLELFADFFTEQNGTPMSEQQESYIRTLIEKIWEEEV